MADFYIVYASVVKEKEMILVHRFMSSELFIIWYIFLHA